MGWMFTNKGYGQTMQSFFQDEWGEGVEILRFCSRGWTEAYAVLRAKRTGDVFGVAIMLKHAPRSYYNLGYKDMDESVGPNINGAPASYIDLLDELAPLDDQKDPSGWARGWRARCRAKAAIKKAYRAERAAASKEWKARYATA
jgi:hypothetical protein